MFNGHGHSMFIILQFLGTIRKRKEKKKNDEKKKKENKTKNKKKQQKNLSTLNSEYHCIKKSLNVIASPLGGRYESHISLSLMPALPAGLIES